MLTTNFEKLQELQISVDIVEVANIDRQNLGTSN